jgi:chromosomal replication initiator protein
MSETLWQRGCSQLAAELPEQQFNTWIRPLPPAQVREGPDADGSMVVSLNVANRFKLDWIRSQYAARIEGVLSGLVGKPVKLELQLAPREAPAPMTAASSDRAAPVFAAAATGARMSLDGGPAVALHRPGAIALPQHRLNAALTFDTLVAGRANQMARTAALHVAGAPGQMYNPLFIYGGVGLGKTHLMHAIAWELRVRHPEKTVLYLSAEQFMYRFVQALRERKMIDFKELFRSVDVLMVDDVQFIAGKDSTQEEFFHTFNALVDQNKQIIISADRAPDEIKDLENRIRSRLQSGLVVDLHPTDYELRLGILQSKAEMYRAQYPGLDIADGVLEFLAHRISTNVRVLEGALTRLFAFASLVGKPINMDLVQDSLADVLRASERKISIDEIQRKVAEHYNIRLSDMIGPKRVRNFARPRQVAMYLCKQLTSRSLPEIGRRFGGRDHTTVMHGVKRIEELRLQDGQIDEDVELLRRALEA